MLHLVTKISRKLSKSLHTRGLGGTLAFLGAVPFRYLKGYSSSYRSRVGAATEEFDDKYGVDTKGLIPLSNLNIKDKTWMHGKHYEGTTFADLSAVFDTLNVDYPSTVFVDIGSGKGRAIMMAAMRPFKKVIGVEFADQLNEVAVENIKRFKDKFSACRDIECICQDGGTYDVPREPLLLFLADPFDATVMTPFIERFNRSYRADPRPVLVFYESPSCAALFDGLDFLKCIVRSASRNIYISPEARLPEIAQP